MAAIQEPLELDPTFLAEFVKCYARVDAAWADYLHGLPPEHPNCRATFEVADHAPQPMRSIADVLRSKYPALHVTSGADAGRADHYSGHTADFPGIAGTSTPQPIEEPMSTQNPYDRRAPRRTDFSAFTMQASPGFMETPQALTIEDLNAMVLSARTRGAQKTADEMTIAHQEEVLTRQRVAWEEGRVVGVGEGRTALLRDIASTWEERANNAIRDAASALEKSDRLTKAELAEQLQAMWTLLAQMVEDHHNGFPAF